jgi:CRP-like cAMP-binding protein
MLEVFRNYLSKYSNIPLSEEHAGLIKEVLRPKFLKKRQFFLQEGEVCKYFGFITKGAMRQYNIDSKGVEHYVRLYIENWWVGDRESWVMLTPSIYNIDAWEDTELLVITKADTLRLVQEIPACNEMVRKMDEMHSIAIQRRLNAAVTLPADKRYIDFSNSYPELIQRFPQHIIASYLGITKETLSRIRRQTIKK